MSTEERVPKPAHSLSELLTDNQTVGEKAKEAAKSAPIAVIAVMAHVVVAAVLATAYIKHELKADENSAFSMSRNDGTENQKIEDAKPEETKEAEMTAIPKTDETDVPVESEDFSTVTDDVVNPNATSNDKFGVSEGQDDAQDSLMSMSSGGKGLAGAIGLGAGSGAGGGARKGNPNGGSRLARRNAQKLALKDTDTTVEGALGWLKDHQSPDGSWDCDNFMSMCDPKKGPPCDGRGQPSYDVGVTGLALLAFHGAGYDSAINSPYRETIKKGLKWLKSVQDTDGCYGRRSYHFTYSHAIATFAMIEAYGMTKSAVWKESAQKGLGFVIACQNPYKAWRYDVKPGDNDLSVTGWMVMALNAAKSAGDLDFAAEPLKNAHSYAVEMTDEETGRAGYIKKGERPVRPEGKETIFPAEESESLTAVGMLVRLYSGEKPKDSPMLRAGAQLLTKRLPVWEKDNGKIDMYYWYYGTLVMFQMGGSDWAAWNKSMTAAIGKTQRTDGNFKGSWDPLDAWGDDGGRIYSTALMAMCLEVYYRYGRVLEK
jgi:hypothetical protein